jgi:serine/threonine protein kinase
MPLPPGARLGPFEIVGLIASGGMGEVYRARDTRLDRAVAIKVLRPEVAADADRVQRFEQEARAASDRLSGPRVSRTRPDLHADPVGPAVCLDARRHESRR